MTLNNTSLSWTDKMKPKENLYRFWRTVINSIICRHIDLTRSYVRYCCCWEYEPIAGRWSLNESTIRSIVVQTKYEMEKRKQEKVLSTFVTTRTAIEVDNRSYIYFVKRQIETFIARLLFSLLFFWDKMEKMSILPRLLNSTPNVADLVEVQKCSKIHVLRILNCRNPIRNLFVRELGLNAVDSSVRI